MQYYDYPSRTVCAVLEEMRKLYETRNFSPLPGLIEECQTLANRMESALEDKKSIREIADAKSKAKKELRILEAEVREKTEQKEKVDFEISELQKLLKKD